MASLPATSPGPGVAHPSAGVHRSPAHIRQVGAGVSLERLYTLVPHVHLPVSLGRPESSGSADPSRRCQGCSHPHRRLPAQAALSFTGLLRQTRDGVLSPPSGNAAPRGARSPRSRPWTGPRRSSRCARACRRSATHDYVRHGTTTLFAALEIATGKVTDACYRRHRTMRVHGVPEAGRHAPTRGRQLHLVCDNYGTHKHPNQGLASQEPADHLHFTPTSGSWLNLVEIFFGIITRQAIRRGTSPASRTSSPRSSIHRRLERPLPPLRLDQDRRRNPAQTRRKQTSNTRH